MRKTSQDGVDTSSITSGVENEIKKPGAILKTKKNSIKRKVQNISHEFDETVIEPLLQNDNERTETTIQSAKYLPITTKTDIISAKGNETNIILSDNHKTLPANSRVISETTSFTVPGIKGNIDQKCLANTIATVHNHMNTNVFADHNLTKSLITPITQILVEIDGTKQMSYSPSPLIFTTAKINIDGKTQNMEPVQVTSVPILSIIEVNVSKTEEVTQHVQRSITGQIVASTNSSSRASKVAREKSVEKDQKPNVNVSTTNIKPGILNNNVQSTINNTLPITKAIDYVSPLTVADAKVSSTKNKVIDKKVVGSSLSNDSKRINEESKVSLKVSEPQSTSSPILQSNIPLKSIPTTSNKIIDSAKNEQQNKKVDDTLVAMKYKLDDSNESQVNTDISRNIQSIGVSNIDPNYSGKSNNVKNVTEASKHDKTIKNRTSSSISKQLQRQKSTKIDDTTDYDIALKKSIPKESSNKSQTKISDHNVSNVSDKFTKPKLNTVNVTAHPVPKVTTTVTSTGKPVQCSASAMKTSPANTGTTNAVKSNETLSNQSNDVKLKLSKPSTTTATTKAAATRVPVTTNVISAMTAVVATTRTPSTTSSITKIKAPNTTSQMTPSIKQSIASTTPQEKAPTSTSSSSLASTSVTKSTTSKELSKPLSSNRNSGTSTAPSGTSVKFKMATKKSDQKSSEHNNDGKSTKP